MTMRDLLTATSIETLRDRMALADDATVLAAGAALAAEIDGALDSNMKPMRWDEERFDVLYAESRKRGTFDS